MIDAWLQDQEAAERDGWTEHDGAFLSHDDGETLVVQGARLDVLIEDDDGDHVTHKAIVRSDLPLTRECVPIVWVHSGEADIVKAANIEDSRPPLQLAPDWAARVTDADLRLVAHCLEHGLPDWSPWARRIRDVEAQCLPDRCDERLRDACRRGQLELQPPATPEQQSGRCHACGLDRAIAWQAAGLGIGSACAAILKKYSDLCGECREDHAELSPGQRAARLDAVVQDLVSLRAS